MKNAIAYLFLLISCNTHEVRTLSNRSILGTLETQLGTSSFYIRHPANMHISKPLVNGSQRSFGCYYNAPSSRYNTYFFVDVGKIDLIEPSEEPLDVIEVVRSTVLGKTANWYVRQLGDSSFIAEAQLDSLQLRAAGKTKEGLDSMVFFASTLFRK